MKKSILTFILAVVAGVFSMSADTKTVNISTAYTGIHVSAGVKVTYLPGKTKSTTITIDGPADRINNIQASVTDKSLNITVVKNKNMRAGNLAKGVTITVRGPLVPNIAASSGATITSSKWFEFKKSAVNLAASSSGDIIFPIIKCKTINIAASSSGNIKLQSVNATSVNLAASSSGDVKVDEVNAAASSSGDVRVNTLTSTTLNATASSSGDTKVSQLNTTSLNCVASSGGDITLAGKAQTGTFHASSGGEVEAWNLDVKQTNVRQSSGGSVHLR